MHLLVPKVIFWFTVLDNDIRTVFYISLKYPSQLGMKGEVGIVFKDFEKVLDLPYHAKGRCNAAFVSVIL